MHESLKLRWLVVCALAGGVCAGQEPIKNPFTGSPSDIDTGRATFRIYCSPCHGIRGEGGRGPDLTLGVYEAGDDDESLFSVISDGVSGTEMAGYGSRMSVNAIWRILAYVRSIARRETTMPAGDAGAGRSVFWEKGRCGSCHRVGRKGGRLGPDLSRVGRSRSVAYLRESILSPDNDITDGYSRITVTRLSGDKVTGVELGIDNFSARLMDSDENIHSFLKDEVLSIEREHRSLMPAYQGVFTGAELQDLLAYLVSRRGEGAER